MWAVSWNCMNQCKCVCNRWWRKQWWRVLSVSIDCWGMHHWQICNKFYAWNHEKFVLLISMNTPLRRTNYLLYSKKQQQLDSKFQGQGVFLMPLVLFIRDSRLISIILIMICTIPSYNSKGNQALLHQLSAVHLKNWRFCSLGVLLGLSRTPIGVVHRRLQTPLAMGLSHHTIIRVCMCFHTNFQLLIPKIEDFLA